MNEGGRGRLLLPFERAEKVARCSFTGRLWGLEETQGSRASHQLPICHSLTALSNIAPSRLYQWSKTMKWQTSPPASLSTGTPGSAHTPLGPTLFFFPPISLVFLLCFFSPQAIFFFSTLLALVSLRSLLDFYLSLRDLQRGKQGFRSLAQVMGGARGLTAGLCTVRLGSSLVEVLCQHVRRVYVQGNDCLLSAPGYYFNCVKLLLHKATVLLMSSNW